MPSSSSSSSLLSLPPDALSLVAATLSDRALASVSIASKDLRASFGGDAVYLPRARRQAGWGVVAPSSLPAGAAAAADTSGGGDGNDNHGGARAGYRRAHQSARRLRGAPLLWDDGNTAAAAAARRPAAVAWERLPPSNARPQRALLLLSPCDADAPPDRWSLPEVCASQDARLWWWRPPAPPRRNHEAAGDRPPAPGPPPSEAERERELRRRWLRGPARRRSGPQRGGAAARAAAGGHHTAAIEAIVALGGPPGGGLPLGYASGALDRTIKLWRPFPPAPRGGGGAGAGGRRRRRGGGDEAQEEGDSEEEDGGDGAGDDDAHAPVAPLRTLRGHQEGVTALAAVPLPPGAGGGGGGYGGGGGRTAPLLLASASLDRTVRVWSLPPALGGGGGGGGRVGSPPSSSSSGGSGGGGPLLAALRGHGGAVTSLALLPPHQGAPALLASGGMDLRVKIWDLSVASASAGASAAAGGAGGGESSAALASSHRLSAPAVHLFALGGERGAAAGAPWSSSPLGRCLAAVSHASFEVVDPRQPPTAALVLLVPLQRALAPIRCAASHGGRVAVGHRTGAAVYDLRILRSSPGHPCLTTASASASAPPPAPLFSVAHPRRAPCDALALDAEKLVTATAAVRLHRGHAAWCWDARGGVGGEGGEEGGDGYNDGGGDGDGDDDGRGGRAPPPPLGRLLSRHSAAVAPVQLSGDQPPLATAPTAGTFDALFTGGEEEAWELLAAMGDAPEAAPAAAAGGEDGRAGGGGSGDRASDDEDGDDDFYDGGGQGGPSARRRGAYYGRLEPGVLALALCCGGSVLATVDTLGSAVVQDFRRRPLLLSPAPLSSSALPPAGEGAGRARGGAGESDDDEEEDGQEGWGGRAGPPSGADVGGGRFWEAAPTR